MQVKVRLQGWWDDLRDSLWLIPTVTVLLAASLASLLAMLEPLPGAIPEGLVFTGTPDGARAILSSLAGAIITVVGLVFSLTVVALQMAASQFTPRLLRTFLRDRRVQVVLSGMIGSAVYSVGVLRLVRTSGEGVDPFVPRLAVTVALLFAFVAVGLLLFFLHHVTQHLRVDVVMNEIVTFSVRQLDKVPSSREMLPDQLAPDPPGHAVPVWARRDGYLQLVDIGGLAAEARSAGIRVRLRPTLGDWVTAGTTLAWAWGEEDGNGPGDREEVTALVHRHLHLGVDRTESTDLAFGLRQLQDVATRALSPGLNDPTTAVLAVTQMSAVLCRYSAHPLGDDVVEDDDGTVRAAAPRPGFGALLELAVGATRRYGRHDPEVLVALVTMLLDLAEHVADSAPRVAETEAQLDRILDSAELADQVDQDRLNRVAGLARETLRRGSRVATVTEAS
ncbi:MAG: DUF2254 domain-containing protein [Nitriliruptoraceae bacterium]